MLTTIDILTQADPLVAHLIQQELQRQRDHLELIASENFTSPAVLAATMRYSPVAKAVHAICSLLALFSSRTS